MIANHNNRESEIIKKGFNTKFIGRPLSEWDKESLRILFDLCGVFTKRLDDPNLIVHENLLVVDVNDLQSVDTLETIIKFAGGTMNDTVMQRITQYNKAQQDVTVFDEYIDDFLNNR